MKYCSICSREINKGELYYKGIDKNGFYALVKCAECKCKEGSQ